MSFFYLHRLFIVSQVESSVCNPKICLLTGLPRVSVKLKHKIHNNFNSTTCCCSVKSIVIMVLLCFVLYIDMFFRVNLRQGKINDAETRIKLIHN